MTPQEADSPAIRLVNVLAFLPIVAIVLIGFYSHKHSGTDGIVGVLLGLYGVGYLVVANGCRLPSRIFSVCVLITILRSCT